MKIFWSAAHFVMLQNLRDDSAACFQRFELQRGNTSEESRSQ
jgi:hypothetical protein